VQVQNLHAAARKFSAQLNLKRMPHVVMDDEAERRSPSSSTPVRVLTRNVSHAAPAVQPPQAPRLQIAQLHGRPDLTPTAANLRLDAAMGSGCVLRTATERAPRLLYLQLARGYSVIKGLRASVIVSFAA
jgi:hypothetical protein